MKPLLLHIGIFFLCFSFVSFAQESEENNGSYQSNTSILKKASIPHLANEIKSQEAFLLKTKYSNGVIINQIGSYNYVNAKLKAQDINVSVVQEGSRNQLLLDKHANEISQKIVQVGKYNSITDFSLYTKYDINMEIIQKGDNQNVQNYGTNSLSKNMKVIQSGNGASVIILNK